MHDIYLDNAATTKPLPQLAEIYRKYAEENWQNPSALYAPAVQVRQQLRQAGEILLDAFGGTGHRCLFTGCGTEGANTVILRGARNRKNMNYICGGAEHPCVEESFRALADTGCEVRFVMPDGHGNMRVQDIVDAVDENTALVSVMHVNNETGAKNDVAAIAAAVKAKNARTLFYADGVQAYLRERVNTADIDYYTVSGHKVHAHKGIGALFYKEGTPLKPLLLGGGQENGLRSGTQNTLGILAFASAAEYFRGMGDVREKLWELRRAFLAACGGIEDMVLISPGKEDMASPHIVSVSFEGVAGETLLHTLEQAGIYISTGSACSSKKGKGRIAKALGIGEQIAAGAVRISFSVFNTTEEVQIAADEIRKNVALLRKYKRI